MTLACKYVDDVVIGAPYQITNDLLTSLNIKKVIHVTNSDDIIDPAFADIDPLKFAKDLGIVSEVTISPGKLTIQTIA
jgi:ethanolamine-phosphate cytidylyltransferase